MKYTDTQKTHLENKDGIMNSQRYKEKNENQCFDMKKKIFFQVLFQSE